MKHSIHFLSSAGSCSVWCIVRRDTRCRDRDFFHNPKLNNLREFVKEPTFDDWITVGLSLASCNLTHAEYTSMRFDASAFKKAQPELAAEFTKATTARRFTLN